MKLQYIGPLGPDKTLPLPEGWPAYDHDESNETIAEAKLASGYYVAKERKKGVKDAVDSVAS